MARGRKRKDSIIEKAVDTINKVINSGEQDKLGNTIYDTPSNIDKEVEEAFSIVKNEVHESDGSIQEFYYWDVSLKDPIDFFDSNLSYELTGYRPITETQGLDFDPDWFTEARRIKQETGSYCTYPKGSKKYMDFWKEQYKRCNEGFISNGYRITGDNYFFLNFYRLKDISSARIAGSGRSSTFPSFYSKQYEYFHYIEICKMTDHDVCALKARGVNNLPSRLEIFE